MAYLLTFLGGVVLAAAALAVWRWLDKKAPGGFARLLREHSPLRGPLVRDDGSLPSDAADELALLVSDLTAELKETADDAVRRLQTAANGLEALLEQAEYQKAYLERVIAEARRAPERHVQVAPGPGPGQCQGPGQGLGLGPGPAPAPAPQAPPPPEKAMGQAAVPKRAEQDRILELAAKGMTVAEIAEKVGVGKGEVALVMNVARQKGAGQHAGRGAL